MARWLYRLGSWSARRAWIVIVAWALLLALLGAGAVTLAKSYTSKMTIPGTEFQSVIDDLQHSLPKAAGGTGTVVFATKDHSPFTQAQKDAIAAVITKWDAVDGVSSATNPFTTQAQLDAAADKVTNASAQLSDGKQQIADGKKKLADAQKQIDAGRAEVAANQAKLAEGQKQLDAAKAQLATGQAQLDAAKQKVATGKAQLAAAQQKVASGQAQLDAASAQIASGQDQLNQATATLAAKQAQLDQAQQQLTQAEQALPQQKAALQKQQQQLDALPATIADLQQALEQPGLTQDQIDAYQQQLDQAQAMQAQAPQLQAKITAGLAQIAAAEAAFPAQQKQLDEGRAQLAAGRTQLQQKQAELDAGKQQIAANQATLNAGKQEIAANQAKLTAGIQQVQAGQAKLTAGQQEIAANQATLDAGRAQLAAAIRKLDAGQAEITAGTRKIQDNESKLTDGQTQLVQGRRELALSSNLRMVSKNGAVAVAQVSFTEPIESVPQTTKDAVQTAATSLADQGVEVEYSSEISQSIGGIGGGEGIGIVIAAVVLFITLGSLMAAGLPLLSAVIGVGTGMLGVEIVTHWVQMSNVTPILAMMLGLAVGIDYTLFILNRHRHQLLQGTPVLESIGRATGTAGSAVLVAGLTVITALVALSLTRIPFLAIMGLAAAATVAMAVLVALTLTPALLRLIGHRILSRKGRARMQEALEQGAVTTGSVIAASESGERGTGWGGFVTRHPISSLVASIIVLATLAVPVLGMRLGLPDGASEPAASTAHKAYTLIADNFGPGQNGAIIAVAKIPDATASSLSASQVTDLQLDVAEQLKKISGIDYVLPASTSADHRTLVFQIVPTTGPSDEATTTLVNTLRDQRPTIIRDNGLTSLGFAGQTVANIDISAKLGSVLPFYLVVVIGISLVLLLLVFRSLAVPLLATAGFLLSVGASFGAVVAVYQWGWLGSLFGVEHPGPVLSFLPILAIGILFGLAMDYQMFLVTGMREAWAHGQDARTAVRSGFSHGSRVITAAGLIMTSVFAGFIFTPLTMARPIGFALAVGVLIDAFVVRMTIMPALMHLLGEKAWYIPAWLNRILPDLDVEGTKLSHEPSEALPSAEVLAS